MIRQCDMRRFDLPRVRASLGHQPITLYYGHFIYAGEVYEGKHAPIISKKLWDEVQTVIEWRSQPTKGLIEPQPYCGLLRCHCGMMITTENKTKRQKNGNIHHYVYYRCTRKSKLIKCVEPAVRSEPLDIQLSDLLASFALSSKHANILHEMINKDKQAEQSQVDAKISDLRASILHFSEKLQRLLDAFLDGVLERDDYTKKKAEILSQKKTLEEQASDLSMGTLEWVEPLRNMLEKAVSICKIAKGADQEAKKSLLLEIFGLNLKLKNKNIVAFSDPKYKSPQENIWLVLRTTKKKIALSGDNSEVCSILEPRSGLEPETSSLPWMRSTN